MKRIAIPLMLIITILLSSSSLVTAESQKNPSISSILKQYADSINEKMKKVISRYSMRIIIMTQKPLLNSIKTKSYKHYRFML